VVGDAHLDHVLSESERAEFLGNGFLVVPDALTSDFADELEEATDAVYRQEVGKGLADGSTLFCPNVLCRNRLYLELLDWHRTFPKVWGILGWNIYSYHSHLGVNPPLPPDADRTKRTLGWHQDSGRVNVEIESTPRPRLSVKVAFWLSDVSEPGRGNFHVIPGSHLWDKLDRPDDGVSDPSGAMPVCVPRGSAVIFDRRLWHAASPNPSTITRKVLFVGYGYRWLRSKDDMTIPEDWFAASDPIRKQLLGGGVNANGHFTPKDDDVPLKLWLHERGIAT